MKRIIPSEFDSLDYKELQKKCKENNLKAVGKKDELIGRLKSIFVNKKEKEEDDEEQLNKKFNNLNLNNVNVNDVNVIYEKIDPKTVLFIKSEMRTILEIGILVSDEIRKELNNNINNNVNLNCNSLSINNIILKYTEIIPECRIKTRRKVIFINAIITLFEDEIKENKNKKPSDVLDILIENGRQTYNNRNNK